MTASATQPIDPAAGPPRRPRRSRLVLAALASALLLGGTGLAVAGKRGDDGDHGGGGNGKWGRFFRFHRMARELGLGDDQREQVGATLAKHWEGGLEDRARAVRAARRELRHAVHDPDAQEGSVREAARRAAQANEELAVARHRVAIDVDAILTPEQREKAKALRAEREARADRRFERVDRAMSRGGASDAAPAGK